MNTAAFEKALSRVLVHEGGFSNDPDDPGGMTYMGISREWYPDWQGWEIIDDLLRLMPDPPFSLNHELTGLVKIFYATEFWSPLQCDFVAGQSAEVACQLMDTAVAQGHHEAINDLQASLNLLNRNQRAYPDLVEDGRMGPRTRGALVAYFKAGYDEYALASLQAHFRDDYYIDKMRRHPEREKFAGWFGRRKPCPGVCGDRAIS